MNGASVADQDAVLASQIKDAMKECDAADATRREKAIIAGKLLAEAQRRHPDKKAFEQFLALAGGIKYRRATDLIAIALGRKDYEQQQAANAAAQQRHRDKRKAERIEREQAKAAQLPKPPTKGREKPEPAELRNSPSAANLREFEAACKTHLSKLNASDLKKAGAIFQRYYQRKGEGNK